MTFLASARLTRIRQVTVRYIEQALVVALLIAIALLAIVYLAGAFEVTEITHAISGNGCGIGTKVIESGEDNCVPPPGYQVNAP